MTISGCASSDAELSYDSTVDGQKAAQDPQEPVVHLYGSSTEENQKTSETDSRSVDRESDESESGEPDQNLLTGTNEQTDDEQVAHTPSDSSTDEVAQPKAEDDAPVEPSVVADDDAQRCVTVADCSDGFVCSMLNSAQATCQPGERRAKGPLGQVPPPWGLLEGSFRDLPAQESN